MNIKFFSGTHKLLVLFGVSLIIPACNMFTSDEERLIEAEAFYEQGKLNDSIILTKNLLQSNPGNGAARLLLGKVQYARFKLPDALDSFKKVKQTGFKNKDLFYFWAKTLLAQNNFKAVSALYADPYFKINVDSPAGMLLKGDMYFLKQNKIKAEEQYANYFLNTKNKAVNCVLQVKLLSISKQLANAVNQSIECEKKYRTDKDYNANTNQYIRALAQLSLKQTDKSYATLKNLVQSYSDKKDIIVKIQASLLLLKMHLVKGKLQEAEKTTVQLQRYLSHPDMYYTRALLAAIDKNYSLAEQHHLSALKLNENYRPSLLELINIKYSQGNIEQAKSYAQRVDNLGGTQIYSQRLNELLTVKLFKKGDLDSIIDTFGALDDGISLKSKYLLALAYAKKGDAANAWKIHDQLSVNVEGKENKDMLRAKINIELGDFRAAKAIYNSYLSKNSLPAMLGMSEVYLRLNKPAQVESILQRALKTGKDSKKVTRLLVRLYIATKQRDKIYLLLNVMFNKTKDNEYHILKAKLYYQNNRYADAIKTSQAVLAADNESHAARLVLANAYMRLKDYAKAEETFNALLVLKPDYMKGYVILARIAYLMSNKDKAFTYLDKALKVKPDYVLAINAKIDLHIENKENERALSYARDVATKLQNKKTAYVILGTTYSRLGDNKQAYTQFTRALKEDASNIKLAFKVYLLAKDTYGSDSAIKELGDWLEKSAEIQNYLLAGDYALSQQDYIAARTFYEKYIEVEQNNPVVYNNLSWIYSESGEMKKALANARKALSLAPESPAIMDTLGWLLVKSNKYIEAEIYLEKAYNKLKDNPTVGYHLATLYFNQDKPDKARAILKLIINETFSEKNEAMELYEKL